MPKYPGILAHRDTIRRFSDIFVIINVCGMYSANLCKSDSEASFSGAIASLVFLAWTLKDEQRSAIMAIFEEQSRSVCLRAMVKARFCCFLWTITSDRGKAVLFSRFSTHGRPGPMIERARQLD